MPLKLKLFEDVVLKKLRKKIALIKTPISDYSMYVNSEFSRARLTHDSFDNQFYLDVSMFKQSDYYGMVHETHSKSR